MSCFSLLIDIVYTYSFRKAYLATTVCYYYIINQLENELMQSLLDHNILNVQLALFKSTCSKYISALEISLLPMHQPAEDRHSK